MEDKVLYPCLRNGYRTLSSTVIILQAISSMADKLRIMVEDIAWRIITVEDKVRFPNKFISMTKSKQTKIFMSDFEFKPIHKFFKITISSIKDSKNTNSDFISLHVYNNTPYQITLPSGLLGYCETNATISPIIEVAYRVNNILQLLDICQSTILDEELSTNNIISKEKRNTD